MLNRFINQLLGRAPLGEPLPGEAAVRAVAALLVRVARADGDFDPQQRGLILRLIERRGGLVPAEARALLAEAEVLEAEAADTVQFTRQIKEGVPLEERLDLMRDLWTIALSDGVRHVEEDSLMRLTAALLGMSDQQSALARQRAAAELGLV